MTKILIDRAVVEQVLDSLLELVPDTRTDFGPAYGGASQRRKKSIATLRAALLIKLPVAQEQEPDGIKAAWLAGYTAGEKEAWAEQPAEQEPVAQRWQPIETAPKGRIVLVYYKNSLGNGRTMRARYYLPETLDSDTTESGWADEGWYEESEAYEYLMPLEHDPTHWMPLPAGPDTAPQPAIPPGFKLVPVEPTEEMLSEGSCAQSLPGPHYISESAAAQCWAYMLAAAPEAPQPAKRVRLTDDEWFEFWDNCQAIPSDSSFPEFLQIARAIERAHGITGEQN